MEVSGVVFQPLPCYSGAGIRQNSDTHFEEVAFSSLSTTGRRSSSNVLLMGSSRDLGISVRPRRFSGASQFSDDDHLRYYAVAPRCGGGKREMVKEKNSDAAMLKKRIKLIKGLSKDLSDLSGIGFRVETGDDLIGEAKEKMISEAAEALLAQLQQLKAQGKEMKKRRKEEKAAMKAARMKAMANCENSSSSSESSDSECGEVVDMSHLRSGAPAEPKIDQPQPIQTASSIQIPLSYIQEMSTSLPPSTQEQNLTQVMENRGLLTCGQACNGSISGGSSAADAASAERIEVCMGGKCKKSGAGELLEQFARRVGVEGAVVGCKCMGKCRDGPNVRVLNSCNGSSEMRGASALPATNPLCIGVGLADVDLIVANFLGEMDMGLLAAS